MKKTSKIKTRNIFRTLISTFFVTTIFFSVLTLVSYGEDRLLIKNALDETTFVVTDGGTLGLGTSTPVRQIHLVGDNATFRMDRTKNTAAFIMVRTDESGNPWKTFVLGTNASGTGVGEFIINDLGASTSGNGTRRMTIANDGNVTFTGTITAAGQYLGSSITLKDNVRTYENALDTVSKLRGVKFDWKDSGKPSVGLIAEEVDKVVPEVVAHNEGNATGVNYASLVGVLVEAVKELQQKNTQLEQRLLLLEGK